MSALRQYGHAIEKQLTDLFGGPRFLLGRS